MTRWLIVLVSAFVALSAHAQTYVGCYTDSSTRALPTELIASGATVENCVAAAKTAGSYYGGVQYGSQCWAGNTLGYSKVADTQCNMKCAANTTEICGGSYLNSIYTAAAKPTVSLFTKEVTWAAQRDLSSVPIGEFPQAATIQTINCRVESPIGAAGTFYLIKAPSGTPLAKGTKISAVCDGNVSGAANQNLLPAGTVAVNAGDTVGIITTNGANWTAGNGMGLVTVGYSVP